MNICSNCGKEVSVGVAHCGHCGHRQEVDQKRTMIGMGAVDPEWQQKLIAARAAAKEKEKAAEQAGDAQEQGSEGGPASGVVFEDDEDLGMAPTQMMDTVSREQLPKLSEDPAPAASSGAEVLEEAQPQESFESAPVQEDPFSAGAPEESAPQGSSEVGPSVQLGEFDASSLSDREPQADAAVGQVNLQGPMAGAAEPVAMDGFDEGGGNKNRTLLIVAIVGVLFACCAVSAGSYFLLSGTVSDLLGGAAETAEED